MKLFLISKSKGFLSGFVFQVGYGSITTVGMSQNQGPHKFHKKW